MPLFRDHQKTLDFARQRDSIAFETKYPKYKVRTIKLTKEHEACTNIYGELPTAAPNKDGGRPIVPQLEFERPVMVPLRIIKNPTQYVLRKYGFEEQVSIIAVFSRPWIEFNLGKDKDEVVRIGNRIIFEGDEFDILKVSSTDRFINTSYTLHLNCACVNTYQKDSLPNEIDSSLEDGYWKDPKKHRP